VGQDFWKIFGSLRQDFDRLFWCFLYQPRMGTPNDFEEELVLVPFDRAGNTSLQLWKPGNLSRYGNQFREESIELWAIEPTRDDPTKLAVAFAQTRSKNEVKFIEENAFIWLSYTDSISWEIYTRKTNLLEKLQNSLFNQPSVKVFRSQSDQRGRAFGMAGLSHVWKNLHG
jgi:hypothetical protein